jgi:hypothetical protein
MEMWESGARIIGMRTITMRRSRKKFGEQVEMKDFGLCVAVHGVCLQKLVVRQSAHAVSQVEKVHKLGLGSFTLHLCA